MAVPARRTSKAKKAKRRTHYKLTIKGLNACSNCGEMKKSHQDRKSTRLNSSH